MSSTGELRSCDHEKPALPPRSERRVVLAVAVIGVLLGCAVSLTATNWRLAGGQTLAEVRESGATRAVETTSVAEPTTDVAVLLVESERLRRANKDLRDTVAKIGAAVDRQQAHIDRLERPMVDRSLPESETKPPVSAARPASWSVLFRADDPSVWDTASYTGRNYAIPLALAPTEFHYLRLQRMDTRQALILPLTVDQLRNGNPPANDEGFWWNGTARLDWGGRHLGIVQGPRYKFPAPRNMIAVMTEGWDAFNGSGFGHKAFVNDKQYYCWHGQEIPRTVFEIAVTGGPLSPEEARYLVARP